MMLKKHYNLLVVFLFIGFTVVSQNVDWKKASNLNNREVLKFHIDENKVQIFELNSDAFKKNLEFAPLRGIKAGKSSTVISVPGFEGKLETFQIYEASVFSPELASKFPNIKSYIGYSTTNSGIILRMSVSPNGIQTMISYSDRPTMFMQPISHGSNRYIVYDKSAREDYQDEFECKTIDELHKSYSGHQITSRDANDQTLRKFRIAISVNGEYAAYHGGTVAGALAAINATLTRVNAVFETDMSVTFELVDATELIYTVANLDPYSSLSNWNLELQNTLTDTIGNAAYDIGHMFGASGGGGNAGCIGCVCVDDSASTTDQNKGSGITSPADGIPEGDNFDIDFVAHEIGHQMGATHTFSHLTEGSGTNAEPGSGTTIMGYAGITGSNNVQQHSDDYFHYHSIRQILDNLETRTCWTGTTITNNPPVASAGSDYTIPQGTAYVLKGTATDTDGGDILSYCWEQTDSGQVTNTSFGPALTNGSINRSLPPSSDSDRYIPKISRVIAGQLTQTNPTINSDWETVATVGRTMNWALTVRDRAPTATGLNGQSSFDLMQIIVDGNSGPFVITSQSTNETWDLGSNHNITWDVAGTDTAPVNTATVNIKLSIDGGLTYPFTLASNVPNDGSHNITVPVTGGDTSTARVMVEGNNNIFYAINATNFSIQESEFVLNVTNTDFAICQPNDAVYNFTYNTFLGFTGTTTFLATNLPAGATATFNPATASANGTAVIVTISGTSGVSVGNHPFSFVGTSGAITNDVGVELNVFNNSFNSLTLNSPANGATDIDGIGNLTWDADTNAQDYVIEIASDIGFTNIVESGSPTINSYTTSSLADNTEYFWRVKPRNLCGEDVFSSVFSFTTKNIICNTYNSADTPLSIPDNNSAGVSSTLVINDDAIISDVNITLNVTHPWIGDLAITLTSPNGTDVTLVSSRFDEGDNYTNTTFDDDATNTIASSGSAPYTGSFKAEESLSLFNGESSNGNWRLKVVDDGPADIGTLDSWTLEICGSPSADSDGDTISDSTDNCPNTANLDQADFDNDGIGDVCDPDTDNDGVLNADDNCKNTPLGDTVGVDGCTVFTLSADNFTLLVASETCRNSDNGSISISAVANYNYTAQLIGNGVDVFNVFTANTDFTGLQAGDYMVCITVENQSSYSQCFTFTVTQPEDLAVLSRADPSSRIVNLELSGGTTYTIVLNDKETTTTENEITLDLATGLNSLKVTTDKDCQGVYKETINIATKNFVYPNPLRETNDLHIMIADLSTKKAHVTLHSLIGKLIFSKSVNIENGEAIINTPNITSGVYILNINASGKQSNHKLIRE